MNSEDKELLKLFEPLRVADVRDAWIGWDIIIMGLLIIKSGPCTGQEPLGLLKRPDIFLTKVRIRR